MIANIKFKTIEDLKMSRAIEEYNFEKFTSDSSDDYPKYADGISGEDESDHVHTNNLATKQADDMYHQVMMGNPDLVSALSDVLTLASERQGLMHAKGMSIGYQPIFNKNKNSIEVVKEFLYNCQVTKDA